MLRLTLELEESLKIGDDVHVVVVGFGENRVKLMVDAPKEVRIERENAKGKYKNVNDYKKEQRRIKD